MIKNKFLFITGCNGQLGSSIACLFKQKNWQVFGLDLSNFGNRNLNGYIKGTVIERNDFKKLFSLCEDQLSEDSELCLINNAGLAVFSPSEDRTYEEFLKVSEVNLLGPIFGMTEFYKLHKKIKNKFRISAQMINIASVYGLIAPNKNIYTDTNRSSSEIYGASKAGIIQMTKYFAARYACEDIRVNCIAPGGIMNSKVQGPDFIRNYSKLVPSNRLCQDKEVAELIFSFVSGKLSYVTGQTIAIDGGMTSW